MSRRAALLAPLLLFACAHASPLERAQEQRSFLWRATMPGQPGVVYLLGSVHFRSSDKKLDKSIADVITKADRLVFEIDVEEEGGIDAWMAENGTFKDGRTLEDVLTAETFERLTAFLGDPEKRGSVPRDRLVTMRPWLVAVAVPIVGMLRNGIEAERGVDRTVRRFGIAEESKKRELHALESLRGQLELLQGLEALDADALVSEMIRSVENAEQFEVIEAYEAGDVERLTNAVGLSADSSEAERMMHRRLITDRNATMLDGIRPFFDKPGTTLVTVGAAHMVDRDGLVQRLADEGAEFDVVPREGPASDEVLAVMAPVAKTYESEADGFAIETPYEVQAQRQGAAASHGIGLGGDAFLMISTAPLPEEFAPTYEAKAHAVRAVIDQMALADVKIAPAQIAGLEAAVGTGTKEGKYVTVRAIALPGRVFTFISSWREGDAEAPEKVDAILSTFRALGR